MIRVFVGVVLFFAQTIVYAQDTLINQYTYFHPIKNNERILNDSLWLKTGYWVELDTISNGGNTLINKAQKTITDLTWRVIRSEGKYLHGAKSGVWKYYDSDGIIFKQVAYAGGWVQGFMYYYPNGKYRLTGFYNFFTHKVDYTEYDKDQNIIGSGSVPHDLVKVTYDWDQFF